MKSKRKKAYFNGILTAILFLFTNCLIYGNIEDRINKSYPVGTGGTLSLESDIGSITVRGADIDSVEIEIIREIKTNNEKRAKEILEDFEIQFTHSGDDVSIQAKYKKRGIKGFWNNISRYLQVKYIIAVPSEYNVDLQTSGGSISVEDLDGEILSKTSGGSITVEEVGGTIEAHTSGGSVKAYLSRQPDSDCRLTTSGGSITVQLHENMNLDVNAKASGGRVHTDFPVSISGEIDKSSMRAKMNGGGPELYLRTSGGSIYLKKL